MKLRTKFQDEDFELGEVVDASIMYGYGDKIEVCCTKKMKHRRYNSIKDFTDHWEDYEEPKKFFTIDWGGDVCKTDAAGYEDMISALKQIGNYFETQEEAEEAVEKLKAWKRLKDKGFSFTGLQKEHKELTFDIAPATIKFNKGGDFKWFLENKDDLFLLFGGEE